MLSPIKNVYFDFFRWLFKSDRYIQALQSTSNLVRDGQALRFSNFAQVDIPLVPHEEQVLLAGFLDRETTKIDALIAEQQRLIELLQEKRQAAISHAVTKGLNPDVPMKDSGVEWLGEVPEHWETQKLLRYINPLRPVTYGILKPGELDPAGPLMIRAQDYSTGWNSIESIVCVSPEVEEPYARSRVDSGDLLITVVGAGTGNTAFVPKWLHGANISRSTCRIALQDSQVDKAYVKFVLDSDLTVVAIELNSTGAAQPVLNIEQIRNLIIPLPPIPEQIAIRRFLEGISSEISDLIQAASSQRFLLQERRSALISAAVTGQIDVRGLAPEVTAA
jgi:type I restriction enzyme S subunit